MFSCYLSQFDGYFLKFFIPVLTRYQSFGANTNLNKDFIQAYLI